MVPEARRCATGKRERSLSTRDGNLVAFSSTAARKCTLSRGAKPKFAAAEEELYSLFKAERRKGLRVNDRWLVVSMKKLINVHYGADAVACFRGSHGWVAAFTGRYDLVLRRANNHKHQSAWERLAKIKRWHARFRRRLKEGARTLAHALP